MASREITEQHNGDGHRHRLRQRFFQNGLQGFHDYEVIELLLTLNTPRKDCKKSAKALMEKFKTFQGVLEAPPVELETVRGVGPVNSLGIKLIKEAAQRYAKARIMSADVVQNTGDLIRFLDNMIAYRQRECFVGVFLDAKNKVVAADILFTGTLTSSPVYPREVIKQAIRHNAAAVIFAHNHPSGEVAPSPSDMAITRRLLFALGYAGIVVHEHLITGKQDYYSFAEHGHIDRFKKAFDTENDQF